MASDTHLLKCTSSSLCSRSLFGLCKCLESTDECKWILLFLAWRNSVTPSYFIFISFQVTNITRQQKKKKKKKRVQLLLPYHQLNKGQHNRHYFGMTVMYKFWLSYVKDENGDISHFTGIDSPINVIIKKWITQTPT